MSEEILRVPLRSVRPFAGQPREDFDPEALEALAENIKAYGQVEPVLVRRITTSNGEDFELINGERRYRALQRAGIPHINIIVKPMRSGEQQYVMAVVCEATKANLSPLEMAGVVRRVWNMEFMQELSDSAKYARIALLFGKSSSWARQQVELGNAPKEVKDLIKDKAICAGAGVALTRLPKEKQDTLIQGVKDKKINKRHVLSLAKSTEQKRPKSRPVVNEAVNIEHKILKGHHLVRDLLQYDTQRFVTAFKDDPDARKRTLAAITELVTWLEKVKSVLEKF